LPLDLEVPYNDGIGIFAIDSKQETKNLDSSSESNTDGSDSTLKSLIPTRTNKNKNIIVNQYNPINENYDEDSNLPRIYTKHKNIIISTNKYNRTSYNLGDLEINQIPKLYPNRGTANSNLNSNWTRDLENNGRPVHKTHVEIITKNGATKKPNLIVNNYNPDNPSNSISSNINNMILNNWLSGRGIDFEFGHGNSHTPRPSYDRKITCMLYLQADHTFFQKMGSDEASIEAITRHVQRANSIYRNTGMSLDFIQNYH